MWYLVGRVNISNFSCQALVDEVEQRINQCHTKGKEDEEDFERAAKALGAAPGKKTKKSVAATPGGMFTDLSATSCCFCRRYLRDDEIRIYELLMEGLSMRCSFERETLRTIVDTNGGCQL